MSDADFLCEAAASLRLLEPRDEHASNVGTCFVLAVTTGHEAALEQRAGTTNPLFGLLKTTELFFDAPIVSAAHRMGAVLRYGCTTARAHIGMLVANALHRVGTRRARSAVTRDSHCVEVEHRLAHEPRNTVDVDLSLVDDACDFVGALVTLIRSLGGEATTLGAVLPATYLALHLDGVAWFEPRGGEGARLSGKPATSSEGCSYGRAHADTRVRPVEQSHEQALVDFRLSLERDAALGSAAGEVLRCRLKRVWRLRSARLVHERNNRFGHVHYDGVVRHGRVYLALVEVFFGHTEPGEDASFERRQVVTELYLTAHRRCELSFPQTFSELCNVVREGRWVSFLSVGHGTCLPRNCTRCWRTPPCICSNNRARRVPSWP